MKRDFLDIDVTIFFGLCNFGNISAIRVIFFLKLFKVYTRLQKWSKKIEKKFFVLEILPSKLVPLNSLS